MVEAAYAVSAPRRLNKQLAPLSRDNPPGRDRRASQVLPRPQPLIRSARPARRGAFGGEALSAKLTGGGET